MPDSSGKTDRRQILRRARSILSARRPADATAAAAETVPGPAAAESEAASPPDHARPDAAPVAHIPRTPLRRGAPVRAPAAGAGGVPVPGSWSGPRSGADFRARVAEDNYLLSLKIAGPVPVVLHNPMIDTATLALHAHILDDALHIAGADAAPAAPEIREKALALGYARDFLRASAAHLSREIGVGPVPARLAEDDRTRLARMRASVQNVCAIAERLDGALRRALDADRMALIDTAPAAPTEH